MEHYRQTEYAKESNKRSSIYNKSGQHGFIF